MEYSCCLPHVVGNLDMKMSPYRSIIFKDLCDHHLRYFLGLEESSVPMIAITEVRDIMNDYNLYGARGPCLFAAQNISYGSECSDLVFAKDDVVIPTCHYANKQFSRLHKNEINLRRDTFISGPVTRYLRLLNDKTEFLQNLNGTKYYCNNFQDLLSLIQSDAVDQANMDAHTTYLINLFEPFKDKIRKQPPETVAKDVYLNAIFNARVSTHLHAESYAGMLSNQFLNLFRDETKSYSGMTLFVTKEIDFPVGPNIKPQTFLGPGGCPAAPDKHAIRFPFTYRHSVSFPNVAFNETKGFVATRNIYDGEELTLEPFEDEDRYVTEASFYYMKYNPLPPVDSDGKRLRDRLIYKRMPQPQLEPKTYIREQSRVKARGDILYTA